MIVYVGNGDIERAIRDLKRKVERDGLLRELRSKSYFLSRGAWHDACYRCRSHQILQ